jgi:hypothetical protein
VPRPRLARQPVRPSGPASTKVLVWVHRRQGSARLVSDAERRFSVAASARGDARAARRRLRVQRAAGAEPASGAR